MGRHALGPAARQRGAALGRLLAEHRGPLSQREVSAASGVDLDAVRKIEQGRVAAPSFFTVADLAAAVGADLAQLDRRLRSGDAP